MIFYEPAQAPERIPVIDLAPSFGGDPAAFERIAREIHTACRETGFFYVSGHGIDPALMGGQFAWAKRLFDLPLEQKLALHMKQSPTASGYEPIGGQVLDSQDDAAEAAPPDLKEAYYCGAERSDGAPVKGRGYYAENQWPSALPGFRVQMLDYMTAVRQLGDHLLTLLARSLDLPAHWFEPYFTMPGATLRLIKYPPQPADARANQLGAGAHTDWGGITLLLQDASGGLEVRNAAGQWIDALPMPGTFVVNLGDLMARWTNGVYSSNMHRVKNRSGGERYSVPYFYGPNADAVIEPMPGCVDADRPRKFERCTAEQHTAEMFRRSYGYSTAESVDA